MKNENKKFVTCPKTALQKGVKKFDETGVLSNEFSIFRSMFDNAFENGQSVWEAILNIVNMPINFKYTG